MKKTFNFQDDNEIYILKNTNPGEKKSPFLINRESMEFDTSMFYEYVFSDINEKFEIEIVNLVDSSDKEAQRVYGTIDEICREVMEKINKKCFV